MIALIGWFIFSITASFLCSVWEAVLLSITPAHAQIRKQEGGRIGLLLEDFKSNIDRPLAAILTLNTLAHTVGAIMVGASASKLWPGKDLNLFGLAISYEVIVAVFMTMAILIFSEIIPKTIGANYWKRLVGFTVSSVNVVIYALYPLVWFSQLITKMLKKDKSKSILSRSDISAIADIGMESGVIREDENRIFKNLMDFHGITAEDVMTPRTVVLGAREDQTAREFWDGNPVIRYSRIPIYKESLDELTGYVLKNEIIRSLVDNKSQDTVLKEMRREMQVVTENAKLPQVLERMIKSKEHIMQVVDEYGGTAGIVTMEDIIETLLGLEILDEVDITTDMQKLAKDRWAKSRKSQNMDVES